MKVAVFEGRTCLIVADRLVDVEEASGGLLPSDPAAMFEHWEELRTLDGRTADVAEHPRLESDTLDCPVPLPRQVFGIGLNYADHAAESAMELPTNPLVFPKFSSTITGPNEPVSITSATVDWEAELVVVIGKGGSHIDPNDAWHHVAGLTVGQDLSDRTVQFEGGSQAQFGLGKSAPGFGPVGPWVTSLDELDDDSAPVLDLAISCDVNGTTKQRSSTRHLIFDVPALLAYLSSRVQLLAGDLIFTGTPSGVGFGERPPAYLAPGDVVTTTIEGLGVLRTVIAGEAQD